MKNPLFWVCKNTIYFIKKKNIRQKLFPKSKTRLIFTRVMTNRESRSFCKRKKTLFSSEQMALKSRWL